MTYFKNIILVVVMLSIGVSQLIGLTPGDSGPETSILSSIDSKQTAESKSTADISTVVQQSPDPVSTSCCAVNAAGTLLCVVERNLGTREGVGGMQELPSPVGLWELPSGRLIRRFQAVIPIVAVFFRGSDLIFVKSSDRPAGEEKGQNLLCYVNAVTGKESRPSLTLPAYFRVESYCEEDDSLLLFNEDSKMLTVFSIGKERATHSFKWKGNSDSDDYAFSIFHDNVIVCFGGTANDYDGTQPVTNYVCFDHDGDVIERGNMDVSTSDETSNAEKKKMFEKLSARLNLPLDFFLITDYAIPRVGSVGDITNDTSQLSFFRSNQIWGARSANFVINLNSPASIWVANLLTNSKTLDIPGQETTSNAFLVSDLEKRRYFTWNVETFLNRDRRSQPYFLDVTEMTWRPMTLPEDIGIVNAKMKSNNLMRICFEKCNSPSSSPLPFSVTPKPSGVGIGRTEVEFGRQALFGKSLGTIDPYNIEDGWFETDIAINASRAVLSVESDEDVAKILAKPRRELSAEPGDVISDSISFSDGTVLKWSVKTPNLSSDPKGGWILSNCMIEVKRPNAAPKGVTLPTHDWVLAASEINGKIIVCTKNEMYSLDSNTLAILDSFPVNLEFRENVTFFPANSEIYVNDGGNTHIVTFSNAGKFSTTASVKHQVDGSPIITLPDNYYLRFSQAIKGVHFSDGVHTYPMEQFDLRLNRPDIVMERLGQPSEAVAIAKELREKRLKRMGVTEEMLKPDFHLPEVQILTEFPPSTQSRHLTLQIRAEDSKYPLARLLVYVNNVPVNGANGESLSSLNTQSLERSIPVTLGVGHNKIQVTVINSASAESLYATREVICAAPATKPNLYLVAMGVSNYSNQQFNLKYAAKDAEDLAEKLKARSGNTYGDVKELVLKDGEVTKDALDKVRDFLKPATVDDSVVLFMAGHGLLDDKYDYYFGTSDIDFNNPAGRGIAFDDMDDILAELPSRKKSLLMDTCHAGELDADEKNVLAAADAAASGSPTQLASNMSVAVRSVGTRGMTVKGITGAKGKSEWYERISAMFVDLRRGSGSTILSSSAGAEYAFESGEQKNGLFTYAVLEALDGKNETDTDKDGKVTMKELCESVKKRVQTLSGSKQTPNTRRLNLESDFIVASDAATSLSPSHPEMKTGGGSSGTSVGSSTNILEFKDALRRADEGDAYGQAVVSIYYGVGYKTPKDLEKSADYAIKSAKQGHPLGIYRLGVMRQNGDGMEKNEEQGQQLKSKSVEKLNSMEGDPYALTALGILLYRGEVVGENKPEAARLYKIAADQGYAPAQYNYAVCLDRGFGVTPNPELAQQYLENAVKQSYPPALEGMPK